MPNSSTFSCAVVGGGLVGKAAALALAQAGLDVALIGAQPAAPLPAAGYALRVYALNAASRALLDGLRVWSEIDPARVQPVAAMHIAADGAALDFTAYSAQAEALAWIVESDAIDGALDLALRFERRVQRLPARLQAVQRDTSGWALQLDDGAALQADLLVGADGSDGAVRLAAGIALHQHDYHQRGIVTQLRCAAPHGGTAFQTLGPDGVVALLPLAPQAEVQRVSLVWSAPEALATELLALPPHELAARVQHKLPALGAEFLGPLTADGAAGSWPLSRQIAAQPVGDAAVLIGDAAHRVHPLAGQGLNLGLQDVQALAAVLGERGSASPADPRLLRRWARARAEQVAAFATATDALARLYAGEWPLPAPLRALGLRGVNALPPVKRWLARYASGLPYLT